MHALLYKQIASLLAAVRNCEDTGPHKAGPMKNPEWAVRHRQSIAAIVKEFMPSGSGVDRGTLFDFDRSEPEKLVFLCSFHHMDGNGYYDGWTEHAVTVRPSLAFDFTLTISGPDRNEIKDYLADLFDLALRQRIGRQGAGPFQLVPEGK